MVANSATVTASPPSWRAWCCSRVSWRRCRPGSPAPSRRPPCPPLRKPRKRPRRPPKQATWPTSGGGFRRWKTRSPDSEAALPVAAFLAQKSGAAVTLLHVLEAQAPQTVHGQPKKVAPDHIFAIVPRLKPALAVQDSAKQEK